MFLTTLSLGFSVPFALQASRMAVAQSSRPVRLLSVYLPHGAPAEHMAPAGSGPGASLLGSGEQIFAPLEPFKDRTLFIKHASILSATNHAAHTHTLTGNGTGASIDWAIANAKGVNVLNLGAGALESGTFGNSAHFSHDGSAWVAPEENVVKLYDTLWGTAEPAPEQPVDNTDEFRKLALARTRKDIETLRNRVKTEAPLDSKLMQHLDALAAVEGGGVNEGVTTGSCAAAPTITALETIRAEQAAFDEGKKAWELKYKDQDENYAKIYRAQLEIAAHAMLCGKTEIVTLQNLFPNSNVPMSQIGLNKSHHADLSHASDAAGRADFAKAQRWMIEQIAAAAQILDVEDPLDPGSTALDNTMIYVFSEISDGQGHESASQGGYWLEGQIQEQWVPSVIIGGGGGALKTGQVYSFDPEAATNEQKLKDQAVQVRSHSDVMLTIARAMGVDLPGFDSANGTGPIQELLA